MRRSNWKLKALIFGGVVAGVIVGGLAAIYVNTIYPPAAGLTFWGGTGLTTIVVTGIGAKVFGIGRD